MKKILLFVVGVMVIGLIIYAIYSFSKLVPQFLIHANPNIVVALIAGMVTMIGYFLTRYFERKKIIEQQIREQKLPVYEEFVSFVFKIMSDVKNGQKTDDKEMEKFMMNFNKKSIIWLSDRSLIAYLKWKNAAAKISTDPQKSDIQNSIKQMLVLEEMFYEFRKDIGHSNKDLKRGDILSLFINDLDKYKL